MLCFLREGVAPLSRDSSAAVKVSPLGTLDSRIPWRTASNDRGMGHNPYIRPEPDSPSFCHPLPASRESESVGFRSLLMVLLYTEFECRTISLPVATNASSELIATACSILQHIYKKGYAYKKAGCVVSGIVPANEVQLNLFDETDRVRLQRLYNTVDRVNKKNGTDALKIAAQGYSKKWKLKNEHISKRYTTNLNDIITIR